VTPCISFWALIHYRNQFKCHTFLSDLLFCPLSSYPMCFVPNHKPPCVLKFVYTVLNST
jgi:hypothetical protein